MNLLVKEDSVLGYAYFCPKCKRFLCSQEASCRFCGQSLDWEVEEEPYKGPVKWPKMEELTAIHKPEEETK